MILTGKYSLTVVFTVPFGQHSDLDPLTVAQDILPLERVGYANLTFHVHIYRINILVNFLIITFILILCIRRLFELTILDF